MNWVDGTDGRGVEETPFSESAVEQHLQKQVYMVVFTLSSGRQNKQKGKSRIKIQKTKNKIRKNKQQQGDTSVSGSNFLFHSERITRFHENEKESSSKTCEKQQCIGVLT